MRGGVDLPEPAFGTVGGVRPHGVGVRVPVHPRQHVRVPLEHAHQDPADVAHLPGPAAVRQRVVHGVARVVAEQDEQLVGHVLALPPTEQVVVGRARCPQRLLQPVELVLADRAVGEPGQGRGVQADTRDALGDREGVEAVRAVGVGLGEPVPDRPGAGVGPVQMRCHEPLGVEGRAPLVRGHRGDQRRGTGGVDLLLLLHLARQLAHLVGVGLRGRRLLGRLPFREHDLAVAGEDLRQQPRGQGAGRGVVVVADRAVPGHVQTGCGELRDRRLQEPRQMREPGLALVPVGPLALGLPVQLRPAVLYPLEPGRVPGVGRDRTAVEDPHEPVQLDLLVVVGVVAQVITKSRARPVTGPARNALTRCTRAEAPICANASWGRCAPVPRIGWVYSKRTGLCTSITWVSVNCTNAVSAVRRSSRPGPAATRSSRTWIGHPGPEESNRYPSPTGVAASARVVPSGSATRSSVRRIRRSWAVADTGRDGRLRARPRPAPAARKPRRCRDAMRGSSRPRAGPTGDGGNGHSRRTGPARQRVAATSVRPPTRGCGGSLGTIPGSAFSGAGCVRDRRPTVMAPGPPGVRPRVPGRSPGPGGAVTNVRDFHVWPDVVTAESERMGHGCHEGSV